VIENSPRLVELLESCCRLMSRKRKSRAKTAVLQLDENLPKVTGSKKRT
jgi:hypothetical protein